MKRLVLLYTVFAWIGHVEAQTAALLTNDVPVGNCGLSLSLTDENHKLGENQEVLLHDQEVFADAPLFWILHNTTNKTASVHFLGMGHAFSLKAFSPQKDEVPLTDLGVWINSGPKSPSQLYSTRRLSLSSGDWEVRDFPALDRLFQFPPAGNYLLEFRYWYWDIPNQRYAMSDAVRLRVIKREVLRPMGVSATSNGVYLVIRTLGSKQSKPSGAPKFDTPLIWRPFSNTGAVTLAFPGREYGIRATMWDVAKKEVPKTQLGQAFGFKFDQLRSPKDSHLEPISAPGEFEGHGFLNVSLLPSPAELFQMGKPGIYTLQIEMQLFRHADDRSSDHWEQSPTRFSPMEIQVIKP